MKSTILIAVLLQFFINGCNLNADNAPLLDISKGTVPNINSSDDISGKIVAITDKIGQPRCYIKFYPKNVHRAVYVSGCKIVRISRKNYSLEETYSYTGIGLEKTDKKWELFVVDVRYYYKKNIDINFNSPSYIDGNKLKFEEVVIFINETDLPTNVKKVISDDKLFDEIKKNNNQSVRL